VDKFTAVSDAIRNYIIRKARIDSQKIVTIHNGIGLSETKVSPIERKEFGLSPGVAIVGVVGRLAKEKGYPYLLNAARVVIKKYPEVHFLIVGDGPQREELVKLASNLGLNDHITFTGYRRDVLSVLALFDIFALATLWEGLPVVILEAMVMAKPVVTTDVMGNPEVVINGVTGFLVPPRDPEILAERILELLKDENLRKRMGGAGRKRIEEEFTIKRTISETERLYEELLVKKRGEKRGNKS
jgi:glycosyltransferase involved in cell wall biosynthesis